MEANTVLGVTGNDPKRVVQFHKKRRPECEVVLYAIMTTTTTTTTNVPYEHPSEFFQSIARNDSAIREVTLGAFYSICILGSVGFCCVLIQTDNSISSLTPFFSSQSRAIHAKPILKHSGWAKHWSKTWKQPPEQQHHHPSPPFASKTIFSCRTKRLSATRKRI